MSLSSLVSIKLLAFMISGSIVLFLQNLMLINALTPAPEDIIAPTIFLIGERKCGSSSLFKYLTNHPKIAPPIVKEPLHAAKIMFSKKYYSLFPTKNSSSSVFDWVDLKDEKIVKLPENITIFEDTQTIDGSAKLFATYSPEQLERYTKGEARILLVLRDPVDRFISHFSMLQRFGSIKEPMESFLTQRLHSDQAQPDVITAGLYFERYVKWKEVFGNRMFLVLSDWLTDEEKRKEILTDIFNFLDLNPSDYDFDNNDLKRTFNVAPPITVSNHLKQELANFYSKDVCMVQKAAFSDYPLPWETAKYCQAN